MKRILIAGIAWAFAATVFAGEAVFSMDGNTVFCCGKDGFAAVHLNPYKREPIQLPKPLADAEINGVTLRTTDGAVLLATDDAIWAWSPGKKTAEKLCDKPAGSWINDVAYDPSTDGVLITVRPSENEETPRTWWLKKGANTARKIWLRRIGAISGPVFKANGTLIFATEGDIWRGIIEPEEDPTIDRAGTLVAVRYAPIACRETYNGSPSQIGARELACSGTKIYAHVARMGGSGWGDIVRLDAPAASEHNPDAAINDSIKERVATYIRALGSVEVLIDNGGQCNLCASTDGQRVYYISSGDSYLVKNNGQPRKLAP